MIYCPYEDSTRDIQSNIPLCLQELPWALPSETPSGEGVYFSVYPSSRPNTDTVNIVDTISGSDDTLLNRVFVFFTKPNVYYSEVTI